MFCLIAFGFKQGNINYWRNLLLDYHLIFDHKIGKKARVTDKLLLSHSELKDNSNLIDSVFVCLTLQRAV
jgi:hypothetical protein